MLNNAVFDNVTGKYNRYFTNETIKLSDKIKSIYDSNHAYIFSSGISATSTAIDVVINNSNNSNTCIIYPSDSYYENIEIIRHKKYMYGIDAYEFNILDINQLYELLKRPGHKILVLESCLNPYGYVFDFSKFCEIKRYNTTIIVDNTWLSGYIFNPLYCGADIVTESMTKFYAANSEIAGCCSFNNNNYNKLFDENIRYTGIHISPNVIKLINEKINDTELRLYKISNNAIKTINYLLYCNITCVHPYFINHVSYLNSCKYFNKNYFIGTFLIGFTDSKDKINDMLEKIKILEVKSSFGYNKTIINKHIYTIKNSNLNFIRFSVGHDDDIDRIIMGINEIMNILK